MTEEIRNVPGAGRVKALGNSWAARSLEPDGVIPAGEQVVVQRIEGVKLLVSLVKNLPQIIVSIVKAVPQIIAAIVKGFAGGAAQMAGIGLNLIKGIWNGIGDAASWLWGKVSGFCSDLMGKIKGFFGIH